CPDWAGSRSAPTGRYRSSRKAPSVFEPSFTQQLVQIVIRNLAAGRIVDIDGLGVFYPDPESGVRFEARTMPQVFIAYVKEDEKVAQLLCDRLLTAGFNPWMDVRKMLPGQNWPRSIENAIETS